MKFFNNFHKNGCILINHYYLQNYINLLNIIFKYTINFIK